MEVKCESHDNTVTAFCRKHRAALCIHCILKGTHAVEGEYCNISAIEEIDDENEKRYIEVLGLDRALKDKIMLLEVEDENLDSIRKELQKKVEIRFQEIIQLLRRKQEITLDDLRSEITVRKNGIQSKLDRIYTYQSKILGILRSLDTLIEGDCDHLDIFLNTEAGVEGFKSELSAVLNVPGPVSNSAVRKLEARFIATPTDKLNLSGYDDNLGCFEFSDALYEDLDIYTESVENEDCPTEPRAPSIETFGASKTDLGNKCERESDEILQSFSNPLYDENENRQSFNVHDYQYDENGSMSRSLSMPAELNTGNKEMYILCPEASGQLPCAVRKLENVADRGFIILDSAHNTVVLVENSGTILDSVRDKMKYGVVLDMCLFKKDQLALFHDYGGFLHISKLEIGRRAFGRIKIINVVNAVSLEELPCTGFEIDPKSQTFFISFPDRVLTIQKGRNGLYRREKATLGELSGIITHFDPRDKSFYTMDGALKILECYSFEKDTILWTISQSQLPSHNFVPATMRLCNPETLGFISSRQFFVVTKKTGSICPTAIKLRSDVSAFCLKRKGIVTAETIVEEEQEKPSVASIKLIEYC